MMSRVKEFGKKMFEKYVDLKSNRGYLSVIYNIAEASTIFLLSELIQIPGDFKVISKRPPDYGQVYEIPFEAIKEFLTYWALTFNNFALPVYWSNKNGQGSVTVSKGVCETSGSGSTPDSGLKRKDVKKNGKK